MKTDLKKILRELYSLDPSLEEKEDKILKILEEMISNKPDTGFDPDFKERLHKKILLEISDMGSRKEKDAKWSDALRYLLVGTAGVALASFMFISFVPGLRTEKINFAFEKEEKPAGAFGKMAFTPQQGIGGDTRSVSVPKGGIGGSAIGSMDSKISGDAMVISPDFEQKVYRYIYSGSGFSIADNEMSVLLKKKNALTASDVSGFIDNFRLSNIDLSRFGELKLNSLNLSQEKDKGLTMNIDMNEGIISISKNYLHWPQANCTTEECFAANRVKIDDIPDDEKLLGIASAFISGYGVDTSSYGKPFVNKDWKAEYDRVTNKADAYVPDTVYVIYPLVLDSKPVYEEYGQKRGISIGIDVKSGSIAEVSGMEKLDFEESKYQIETNSENILKIAEKGGRLAFNDLTTMPANAKTVNIDVKIGEPATAYAHMYDFKEGKNYEYMVPAMVFPVLQEPKEGEYFPKQIVVPIVKDLITDEPIRLYR